MVPFKPNCAAWKSNSDERRSMLFCVCVWKSFPLQPNESETSNDPPRDQGTLSLLVLTINLYTARFMIVAVSPWVRQPCSGGPLADRLLERKHLMEHPEIQKQMNERSSSFCRSLSSFGTITTKREKEISCPVQSWLTPTRGPLKNTLLTDIAVLACMLTRLFLKHTHISLALHPTTCMQSGCSLSVPSTPTCGQFVI